MFVLEKWCVVRAVFGGNRLLRVSENLSPAPPREPYQDDSGIWMLSRYDDVLAAFREPLLWPTGSRGQDGDERDEDGVSLDRRAIMDGLSSAHVAEWRAEAVALVTPQIERLPT